MASITVSNGRVVGPNYLFDVVASAPFGEDWDILIATDPPGTAIDNLNDYHPADNIPYAPTATAVTVQIANFRVWRNQDFSVIALDDATNETIFAEKRVTVNSSNQVSNVGGQTLSQPPSGEGTGAIGRVRYNLTNSTGGSFPVSGNGPDDATALAEANAKLALVVGTIVSTTQTTAIPSGSQGATHDATGEFEDATITLSKTVSGRPVSRTIKINNMSTAYRLANSNRLVNVAHADIAAYATAYRDGDGLGGYTAVKGTYTK